jgi:hypothetical protein
MVADIRHTPNVSFEGQNASEWATNQVVNYPSFGTFTTASRSYSALDGLVTVTFGSIVDLTTPVSGTSKSVFTPPFLNRRYTLAPGESTTSTSTMVTTTTLTGMPPTTQTTSHTQTDRYLGQESVTVPAGTFNACKFETANQTTWEAVGRGVMVKSISLDSSGGTTTMQLTAGSINGTPIQ